MHGVDKKSHTDVDLLSKEQQKVPDLQENKVKTATDVESREKQGHFSHEIDIDT